MAESFPSSIAANILTEMGFLSSQATHLSSGVRNEITKLLDFLSKVKDILSNAEARQSQNRDLQDGLEKISDLLYEAEDVLDELKCEVLARQVSTLHSVKYYVKIRGFRKKLDVMAATIKSNNNGEFRLIYSGKTPVNQNFMRTSEVFGRKTDKENIIHFLMNNENVKVSVIPILGIGGIGKTTLIKQVYNDKRIDELFDLKMWVNVPEDFDMIKLMKEAYASATGQNHDELAVDKLEDCLLEKLVGKKFLLVLDDVWNENYDRWEKLKNLFTQEANGGKIVVTTRSDQVAKLTGTVPISVLKSLLHEDCMLLFVNSAFRDGSDEANPELARIGDEIVRRCGGIPLVVKTLGTLLYQNTDTGDWVRIRDGITSEKDQNRDSILSALKLSYVNMPSHLRRCLAYCALFPRGYCFSSNYLICDWMAHGLLVNPNEDFEDTGLRYLKELIWRCFFQDVEDYGHFFTFKMHNLIYHYVEEVAQGDCKAVDLRILNADVNARHLYLLSIGNAKVPSTSNNLRTVLMQSLQFENVGDSFIHRWTSSFKYLRQLSLSGLRFSVLPDSVSALKHLRFLDLSWNLDLRKLPDSICKLLSLQTLKLLGCSNLEKLPKNLPTMISLRYLEITIKETSLPQIGDNCLSSLRYMHLYNCHNLVSLPEGMQHLTDLRTLILQGCEGLLPLPDWIKNLTKLSELKIQESPTLSESCRQSFSNISHVPEFHAVASSSRDNE